MELITSLNNGDVTRSRLNRPEVYNSFNQAMAFSLQKELDLLCSENDEIRTSAIITGSGKAFCAGQDLGRSSRTPMGLNLNPSLETITTLLY